MRGCAGPAASMMGVNYIPNVGQSRAHILITDLQGLFGGSPYQLLYIPGATCRAGGRTLAGTVCRLLIGDIPFRLAVFVENLIGGIVINVGALPGIVRVDLPCSQLRDRRLQRYVVVSYAGIDSQKRQHHRGKVTALPMAVPACGFRLSLLLQGPVDLKCRSSKRKR